MVMMTLTMLKICDSVITEPLSIIFKNCTDYGVFPNTWKMSHIIPVHKKNCKCSLNNYHPVSLLLICGKIFERIIYSNVFLYFEYTNLLLINQVLGQMTHVSISSCQLCTVYIQILIIIHHLKLEATSLIFQKHLTKFGMMVFYINLKVLVLLEIY